MVPLFARLSACALVALPAAAFGATCQESFAKKGNPVTGLRFTASVTVQDVTPANALRQLRGAMVTAGYDILADEAEYGSLLMEQPMTGTVRAFPITANATASGKDSLIVLESKPRAGQMVKEEPAKAEMCRMLTQIVGGKAGIAAAARGTKAVAVSGTPVAMNSLSFSQQVSKDTERNAAAVMLRYKGKAFTIDGLVDYVTKDGETFRVGYKIPNPWEQAIRLPNQAPFKTDIACMMAKGQAGYSLQLKPGKSIKLTGRVVDFNEYKHVIWLEDCRPAG